MHIIYVILKLLLFILFDNIQSNGKIKITHILLLSKILTKTLI